MWRSFYYSISHSTPRVTVISANLRRPMTSRHCDFIEHVRRHVTKKMNKTEIITRDPLCEIGAHSALSDSFEFIGAI